MLMKYSADPDQVTSGENTVFLDLHYFQISREVVERLTRDRGVVGSSLTGGTVLCP